ncbi:membrane protein insertase YidC [Acidiferrimicrobium sp. IK]|uniref:membrane protein insertase YidC n=1 Tax=Acidiferrimicrobium sp. IK TaxID=2871700 RepID=UPI0021CB07CC|nr:membrane protein insertase YidC [Acidiferrimicrobium sp. IK]MCU4186129.1 membrane protein insertase YidC [Acidiferrimicrobium sp. IK]
MHFQAAHVLAAGGLSLDPIAKPIAAILAGIYSVIPNYGVAILVLSLAWMILIAPLTLKTTRSMLAMQKLQPQIKKLQEQHRNDRAALSQATMDLYKEHNVSPFGSCLPTLLPLPVFFALFRVIDGLSHITNGTPTPRYLSKSTTMYHDIVAAHGHLNAFGVDLSKNALSSHSGVGSALPYFILLLIMMGTQYAQTVQMMNRNPANADNPQAKIMKYLPLIFGVICIRFPAGVVLYYGMSNLCRIAQQTLMYRYDPKVKALAAQEIKEIEAETRDIETGKRKREAPSAPAPKSRFRDLLSSAAEQSAKAREERAAREPGRTPSKGASAKATPPKGPAAKGQAAKGLPQAAPANKNTGAKATGAGKGANGKAVNGSGATPTRADGNGNGDGAGPTRPRTGAGAGNGGRTGAARTPRTNRKRRGR